MWEGKRNSTGVLLPSRARRRRLPGPSTLLPEPQHRLLAPPHGLFVSYPSPDSHATSSHQPSRNRHAYAPLGVSESRPARGWEWGGEAGAGLFLVWRLTL